jgi:hypothetical protein
MEMQETLTPEQTQPTIKSPYLSIWFHPRKTIRHILDSDPNKHVVLFSMLLGILTALDKASDQSLADTYPGPFWSLIIFCVVIGLIFGPIRLYIYAVVYKWVGSLLGGVASRQEVKTTFAWSFFPMLFALPIWFLIIQMLGRDLFSETGTLLDTNPLIAFIFLICYVVLFIINLWAVILLVINLSEVHQFSIWKGILTFLLPRLIIIIPTVLITMVSLGH